MFTTIEEAREWIENSHRFGEKLDLVRMKLAAKRLGRPENSFKSIHIAGTNGKGSTTNYIKNILLAAGHKVGIYTSPFVVMFNERMGIDDDYISDEETVMYANRLQILWDELYATEGECLTFFEILTLMSFLYFRDHQIEYAAVEVGLGGLLDATNIITPEVSVITNISWDHMKQLGNTLESIAMNKLGIVKPGHPLVTTEENPDLRLLFASECASRYSDCVFCEMNKVTDIYVGETTRFTYEGHQYVLQLPGYHQIKNAILAIETIKKLSQIEPTGVTQQHIHDGLARTVWAGRFEIFHHNVVLDGAHNIGAFETLIDSIHRVYPGKYVKILFCMMKDKEHQTVIGMLDKIADEFHFTQIDYKRAATAQELYDESHHPNKFLHENFAEAYEMLKHPNENEILVVTGSLYFVSAIRPLMLQ